ncbi:cbb3-type cytochrome c oxidase subunit 3 [Corticibacter populi]|uniref:Cbb3-type cytochrome c oxidase subunit 3 n=1 Tax=Corticibacter populi TaxID=1550736 RepID=A0A3M6R0Q3_9BURK|nr:cbb3-type cytochrome c oxidase subunit 3 [Corticibacter populi]RMX08785.1 cbb3-type cytochrome c oxidase subunit 3 [Corticibacter populi]RZS36145.1 cytochrome c oxidase cbb3-type subunit 4 [Corticibacter populi]
MSNLITDLRVIATLLSFAVFIGIVIWTYSRKNEGRFDEAAHLPFEEDSQP